MNQRLITFLFPVFLNLLLPVHAQVVTFFDESPDEGFYDTGLAFVAGSSTFTRTGPSGDKLPVSSGQAYRGNDALSFTWNSKPGGNWDALVIAPGWIFQDITASDTLSFWVYSTALTPQAALPMISMEGAPGTTKSLKYSLSQFQGDIPAQTWTRVRIPLDVFFLDPGQTAIQFDKIKAIIFSQGAADATTHQWLVDDVKTVPAASGPLPAPSGLAGLGYERHGDFTWEAVQAPNLDGYHLYYSENNGQTYQLAKYIPATDTLALHWWGDPGNGFTRQYRLTALGFAGEESAPSAPVTVTAALMTNDEFMDMVQRATLRYFWDFAHPVSGLARERNSSGNTVTIGGSGFGIMALLVGIDRGWIDRAEGRERLLKITAFLQNADRFHGAWPHWMDGNTGNVIPFSAQDNGGDLVETSFMVQGLLAARSYFHENNSQDSLLRARITALWESVEWNWYRRINQPVLYWHWSPNFAWAMNFALRGFNETHITYLLAIASPTNGVPASLYQTGWASAGYVNGQTYDGYKLDVGPARGGPLFFAHYSYLGFDPRNIRDAYTNYFVRNAHHTLINRAWCIQNPGNHPGYGPDNWGLTASDNPFGYLAHEATLSRDNGTIAPTAALSSMPYTPTESMAALKNFYRVHGERLWGTMGFKDAFNLRENWFANSYLAIDQGPIIVMIENYRSRLLWDLFMENPEIQPALDAIGFVADTASWITAVEEEDFSAGWVVGPNPVTGNELNILAPALNDIQGRLHSLTGQLLWESELPSLSTGAVTISLPKLPAGAYVLSFTRHGRPLHRQVVLMAN